MIKDYYRPKTLQEAAELLDRYEDKAFIVGGGTFISTHQPENGIAVDLQDIRELHLIENVEDQLVIGSQVTLQQLAENEAIEAGLRNAIKYESGRNIRQCATIAGALVTADGRSPLAACLLALDTKIVLKSQQSPLGLGDWFPLRLESQARSIITHIILDADSLLKFEYSARTPKDLPLVFAAAAFWPGSRTRIALGGHGSTPVMVYDGPDPSKAANSAQYAYSNRQDYRASAEYRSDVAGKLVARLLANDI